jgi:hypothetical protein
VISNFSEQTLTGRPVKQEPKKTGRKYGSSGLTYPIELGAGATAEMDNHIIFDIYFDETTSFSTLSGTKGEPKAWRGGSAGVGNKITKTFNDLPANAEKLLSKAGGAAGFQETGNAAGATVRSGLESANKFASGAFAGAQNLKKLNSSIALSVPNTYVASSTANFTEAKMGAIVGALSRMGSGNMGGESISELGGQAARIAMETFAQLPDAFGMNLQNVMEVSTRRVSNPHIEQRFESVAFREFSFVYEFAARSEAEAIAIDNIIKTFRFHMHPELIPSGLFFDYPSLFDISVRFKDGDNRFMHKISTCYLTAFTTNYTSTGVFATNRDGQPTEIQCTMNFREIEPLHKQRIAEGY